MAQYDSSLPPSLRDNPAKLLALRNPNVRDTGPGDDLDVFTRLAADRFDTAIAIVVLVDGERQWLKSRFGLEPSQTCHIQSLCALTIASDKVMVVGDASNDPRLAPSPVGTGAPHIGFFAGAPLLLANGRRIGVLCVVDPAPRDGFNARDAEILALMAGQVVERLESHRIRTEERISQLIAQTTTDAIVCADAASCITLWNRAAEVMFGWSAEEAIGESLDLIIPDRHRHGHHAGVARLRARGPAKLVGRTVEVPATCKAGHEIPVELSLAMWPADGGEENAPAGFAAIIRDISARKRAEEERIGTEARLARQVAAIEASDDGIAITDPDGVFIFMNRAHALMFGYEDPAQLTGKPWHTLYDPLEVDRINEEAMPVLFSTGQWRGETRGVMRDKSPIEQEVSLSLSPEGGIVCVTRDVDERRAMEREKVRLREQLMLAQRQEVVGQLASGIAHDFNNIIAAISGTADLLRNTNDEHVHKQAARIQFAASTAAALVEKLMKLGQRTRNTKYIDLCITLRSVRDLVVPSLADPLHRFELELPPNPIIALTDDTELSQVVLNLALNARDALRPGEVGRIKLELITNAEYRPEGTLVVGTVPEVPAAVIRVSDTGCGIAPDHLSRVFEPFFTEKGAAGTGLGLAVVAGIIAANNGALAIQSWSGCGTIFEIWWPLQPVGDSAEGTSRSLQGAVNVLAGKTVLVVDDNPTVTDTLVAMLEELGAEVGPCIDPHDAIAVLREDPGSWDLVITDYDMPGMNGAQLAHALRRERDDLPILLLTALPRVHQLHQNQVGLFDGVLGKPASTTQIAAAAATAIDAARTRSQSCIS